VVGRLIPAGTGGATQQMRKIAVDRDSVVIEARKAEAEAALALAAPEEPLGDVSEDLIVDTPEESRDE